MLEELKREVLQANLQLSAAGLAPLTWGNASGIDRERGLVVIKPSGVSYEELTADMMCVVDLDGNRVEDGLNPSSDTDTHLVLYRAFPQLGGVVHTHSPWAVAWAQSGQDIPCFGTTHADTFFGSVPCCRSLTDAEIQGSYEKATGDVIVETLHARNLDPMHVPAVLCAGHGPFAWGASAAAAAKNAQILEYVAQMALMTILLKPDVSTVSQALLQKHFLRKHGKNAYYGQEHHSA